ncbi:MAG TPA: arylamine N-acetyltransferase [Burkholderiaceae bacterium]|jgi:N-hydroxyarylamine O-acetyltransferase|nr:arylamine N-acetyltransferase [Burkholderiaceae bacterium]
MNGSVDLDAYFERIGWGGPTRPDYDTLAGLLGAHMARIPFENLEVLLGRPVRLDLEALQRKLVQARRGGYCFEHSTLLAAVLEQLGFAPVRHTARVVLVLPRHESPRTHMVLTVPLREGTFILDPGFGALAPRTPVRLADTAPVHTGHEAHWMARAQGEWVLRAKVGEKVADCWVSSLEPDNLVDFEVGNHYTATHPMSPFVNRIMMRALTPNGRVTVMNRDVTVRDGGTSTSSQLADRVALRGLLAGHFGFDLPEVERLRVPSIPEWSQ